MKRLISLLVLVSLISVSAQSEQHKIKGSVVYPPAGGGSPIETSTEATIEVVTDSDGDGLKDSDEDLNRNGKYDKETEPSDLFKADTDDDGVMDGVDLQPKIHNFLDAWEADAKDPVGGSLYASYNFTQVPSSPLGSKVNDISGNSRHATARNSSTTAVTGVLTNATNGIATYGFDCSGSHHFSIDMKSPVLSFRSVETVSMWVYLPADSLSTEQPIFSYVPLQAQRVSNGAQVENTIRAMFRSVNGNLEFVFKNWLAENLAAVVRDRWTLDRPAAALEAGWHHLAFVWQGGDGASQDSYWAFYLDGRKQTRTKHSLNQFNPSSSLGQDTFVFGTDATGGSGLNPVFAGTTFAGKFDRVRLYSDDLSAANIAKLVNQDTDGDGFSDVQERQAGRNPAYQDAVYDPQGDYDEDGIKNVNETNAGQGNWAPGQTTIGTNPLLFDTDGDMLGDGWEHQHNFNPFLASSPGSAWRAQDDDGDGLSNLEEFVAGTKHAGLGASDSDSDGYSDKEEMDAGSDPLDINSKPFKASEAGPDLSGLCGNLGAVGVFKGSAAAPIDEFNLMVGVGDYSISKSELWVLNTDQSVLHAENSTFGIKRLYLKPNRVYKVSLMHGGSTEGEGNWDYAAFALPYSASAWDYLLGEHNPDNGWYQASAFNNLQRLYDGFYNDSPPVPETPSDFIVWNQDEKIGGHKLLDLVPNTGPPEDTRPAFQDALDAKAYLIPVSRSSYSSSLNLSSSDAAGPRYRKIGLNGMPLADEKPEGQGEVDQANEETYVDAFDLSLRHDTSFVYLPLASSDLVLQAAASVSETTWNDRSGINPHEQMTAPFGAGWTSNLSSYVEIAQAVGTAPKTDPVSVNVVDEDGRAQRFATADGVRFFAWPSGTTDRKSYLNTLEWKAGPSGNDEFLVLRKKFGNTLVYRKTPVWLLSSGDRLEGAENGTRHNYWRLQSVTDRYGNQLIYDYGAEWTPGNPVTVDNGSLIPKKIYCPQRPGQELTITRRDCRTVQSITDPSGRAIQFVYGEPASINGSENGVRPSQTYEFPVLRSVLFPDGTKNQYGYDMEPRYETILPTAGQDPGLVRYTWYFHVNVGSITDKKGKTHVFGYDFNDSVQYYEASSSRTGFYAPAVSLRDYAKEIRDYVDEVISEWNSQLSSATEESSWKVRYGLPRQVTSVSRPGLPGVAVIFSRSGGAFRFGLPAPKESGGYHGTKPVYRGPESVTTTVSVTGGEGADVYRTKYSFTGCNAELVDADIVTVSDPNSSNGLSNSSSFSAEWLLSYEGMTISLGVGPDGTSAQGSESYAFSPEAGYALVSSTGIYGDKTIWGYEDPWNPDNVYSPFRARGRFTKWADPVSKTDALGRTEQYQYGAYRVMTSSVDVHNTETSTSVDHLGRRTGMVIKDLNAGGRILRQESYFYDQPRFKSFMTKKIVRADLNNPTGRAWEKDIVSTYEADGLGRLWKETTYPGGNPVVTTYEYNIFNQKTKVTDPRSNVTNFRYDLMNRLVEVDHPETMTPQGLRRSVTKTIYDSNGNKTVAIDENGHATIWLRDALNRVTHEIRDMDGKGIPFAATGNPEGGLTPDSATPLNAITSEDEGKDLVTETFYNKVDAPVAQIDPRGYATVTLRDSISRPVHVFAGIPKTSVPGALSLSAHAGPLATMAAGSTSITHTEMVYPTAQVVGDEKIANVAINGTPFRTYPGGSIFASDGLKASETIHHDVVLSTGGTIDLHSYAVHDGAFRPTRLVAQYRTDGPDFDANHSTIVTQFSDVRNGKEGRIVTNTDALGKKTETELDAMGRDIKVTERGNQGAGEVREITKEYSSTGLLFRTIDVLGRHTEIDYDGAGRPVKQWSPDPVSGLVNRNSEASATLGSPATTSVYDGAGNVVAVINPLGHRTDFEYDARNRKIAEMLPPVRDAANPDAVLENLRPTSRTWYDLAGNAVASKDARGNITRVFYDKANRGHASRSNPQTGGPGEDYDNPLAGDITTSQKLDEGGLPTEATDGNGNITRNAYDSLGRLIRTITDPATGNPPNPADVSFDPGVYQKANSTVILVTNEYDDLGNLVSVKDGKGAVTGFRYDGAKRKTRTIWDPGKAAEREEKWIYNALLLTERIDGRDLRTLYAYDGLHRLTDVLYGAASGQTSSSHADNQIRDYDLGDRLKEVNYPNEAASKRAVAYGYDELDRVVSETSAATTHVYTYDKAGNRLSVVYGRTGRMLISTYDALNRLETCVEGLASEGNTNTTSYLYDRGGKVTRKVLPNSNRSDSQYDFLGRTLRIVERNSHNSPLVSFDYTRPSGAWPTSYDGAGNVLQVAEGYSSGMQSPVRTVLNTYDKANRLLREDLVSRSASSLGLQARIETKITTYAYDAGNNRVYKGESSSYQDNQTNGSSPELPTEYVYGSGVIENGHAYNSNQLIYYGKSGGPYRSFTYDANGNRWTATFNGSADTYSWDFENRLLTLDLGTGSAAANGEYAYAYDYRSRRISRAENNASEATLTVLSFSGGNSVLEMNQDGSDNLSVQSEMIRGSDWGGGVGGLLYSLRGGQFAAKSYNSRGDVVSQTDSSGAVTWQAAYEAFGTRSQETDPTDNPDRQRANTKEEDPTGLLNEGFRYRDLATGVFISRDPAGFIDGPNVYTYVRQNPWTKFDPLGLQSEFRDQESPKNVEEYEQAVASYNRSQNQRLMESASLGQQKARLEAAKESGEISPQGYKYGMIQWHARHERFHEQEGNFQREMYYAKGRIEHYLASADENGNVSADKAKFRTVDQYNMGPGYRTTPTIDPIDLAVGYGVGRGLLRSISKNAAKELPSTLNPKNINFMQSSIRNQTGSYTVLENAKALANGGLKPADLPAIRVWQDEAGKIWSLDHRRLGAFRLGGVEEVPVQWADSATVQSQMWKMTTKTGGGSIKLKLEGGASIAIE